MPSKWTETQNLLIIENVLPEMIFIAAKSTTEKPESELKYFNQRVG